ncbi:MAG: anthranilate synthase component I [Chloroflexi bacterium]|nr:anthranilate synthase component I [Chloroflexota bacterium]
MIRPTLDEMTALAAQGNLIPVWRELPADLDTPVSIYLKLAGGPGEHRAAFLLESVEGGEQVARYSFIGVAPSRLITIRGDTLTVQNGRAETLSAASGNPLDALRDLMRAYRAVPVAGLPRFTGGLVGYLAYDIVRRFERIPATAQDELGLPDGMLALADTLVAFDHVKHRLLVIAHAHVEGDVAAAYADAVTRVDQLAGRLRAPLSAPAPRAARTVAPAPLRSNMSPAQYGEIVLAAKEHIAAGDAFQIVLSQRFERETDAAPFGIYRALRRLNPSPYMFFLDFGDTQLVGASPEMMVRLEDGRAEVRPIAGTRRRGATDAEDEALAQGMLADPKERAEHVMLVDLGRNDLGRVAQYGSVHVAELMGVEKFSHVMHIVSRVRAALRPEFDAFDLFRATFPAGTLSGAPKIRAMQIIEDLEGTKRGAYGGAVGYFDYAGNMDTCITIRTIVMRGRKAYIQAGAGIVADSDPAAEYQECVNKAKALAEAIRLAEEAT